ncbi:transposase [Enterobacter sp. JMULE2]|uniref:Mu transposase C-terminal domain-containing protein n=1 Tax=Enterobacter sp. JMULE2 TaxID=2518340 RepID=UPI001575AA6E|nr:Mu transposase C-terminal domain-containing protein [Enterobacter sp. JMULE2]NTZ40693.1 transposase [Enterobacter sp. JMULE2]
MFFVVKELVGLPGMPKTEKGIRESLAKRTGSVSELVRKREGTKAFEYHIDALPAETQEVLRKRHYESLMETPAGVGVAEASVDAPRKTTIKPREALQVLQQCPALLEREIDQLTGKQKQIADARAALAQEVMKLIIQGGLSRNLAVNYIVEGSRNGTLPGPVMQMAELANARKGKRLGVGRASLQEWYSVYQLTVNDTSKRLAMLAPGHHKATKPEDVSWLPRFLSYWRNTNGPTMSFCYRDFSADWKREFHDQPAMLAVMPSYDAVCRVMKKLPKRERLRGRVTGSAARALEVYSRRDWSTMPVNGCWVCDGKSLDMKVKHPISKTAFTPELTLVIDGRSRFVVGWSLSYSENVRGVSEAYRYAIQHYGKPLFVYTDNGSGQKNKTLDAETTGIFPRLGIEHMTGIPGNPQARGIIERLNGVIPYAIAQRAPTYNGRGADRDNHRRLMVAVESAENALSQGKPLNARQRHAVQAVPEWDVVMQIIQEEIDSYNNSHEHSELPRFNGKHLTPARYREAVLATEGDEIEYLTEVELREMFMPEELRTVERGWVRLNNNRYFSHDLADFDGVEVRVAYDTRSAEEVIVRKTDGAFICKALWNGNTRAAIPVTEMERQERARTERRLGLLEKKAEKVRDESRPALDAPVLPDFSFGQILQGEIRQAEEHDYHFLEVDRDQHLKKTGTSHE